MPDSLDLDTIESDLARLPGGLDLVARLVHHIPALVARVRELEAERDERTRQHAARGAEAVAVIDELRLTLLNERGEGAGPSEGWEFNPWPQDADFWWREGAGLVTRSMAVGGEWFTESQAYPTAREAMRAADLARAGGAK